MSGHRVERVAIVLTGAAARGAFQAGALAALLTGLAEQGRSPTVAIGTSAGALNSALWASCAHLSPGEIAHALRSAWMSDQQDVIAHPALSLPRAAVDMARSSLGLGGGVRALLDTSPLAATVDRYLDAEQVAANVEAGIVEAVGVVATRMPAVAEPVAVSSGRSVVFLDTRLDASGVDDPERAVDLAPTSITAHHVLASSAIPMVFPAAWVPTPPSRIGWYLDGGIRLNAPIRPAVQLGADRIVVVSAHATKYGESPPPEQAERPSPDAADAAAHVLHAVLADSMVEDLADLRWKNQLCEQVRGPVPGRSGRPLRRLPHLAVGPRPGQLAHLAEQVLSKKFGARVWDWWDDSGTWVLGRLIRGLGDGPGRAELLSYLAFDRDYFLAQVELGRKAAEAALAQGWQE